METMPASGEKTGTKVEFINFVNLKNIKPYENNPRENEGAVEYVKNSILEFGFKRPLIVDENFVILAGHTRYKALLELGYERAPCVVVKGLTEAEKTAYRIKDNRAGELTLFDFDKVAAEIQSFAESGIDMTAFGFEPPKVAPPEVSEGGLSVDGAETDAGRIICPRCGKVVE